MEITPDYPDGPQIQLVFLYEKGRGRSDTDRRQQCDHEGRDGSDVATSQGHKQPQVEKEGIRPFPRASKGNKALLTP